MALGSAVGKGDSPPPPLVVVPATPTPPPPNRVASPPSTSPQGASPEPSTARPMGRGGVISVGIVAGVVAGAVALLVVAILVLFFVKRRHQQEDEGDASQPQQQPSPSSMREKNQMLFTSKGSGDEEDQLLRQFLLPTYTMTAGNNNLGNTTSREGLKLSPLQSPMIPQDLFQLPESQLHSKTHSSTSGSSSTSTVDKAQPSLVSVGVRTFDYKELYDATSQFSQDKFLGQGGFGSVFRGVLAGGGGGGGNVAIKQLQTGSFQGEREFLTEINVISRVHHRNLVSLVGYCVSGSERLLVYEYVENNDLAFHLKGNVTPLLDWATRLSIALGAAKGISYLHEECHPRIIHRDIKSTNILLDSCFRAKVADFGLAKFVPDDKTHVTTRIMGTFGYLAPEFGSSGRLTEKSDVFSFGIVLLELITGRQPINLVEWASPFLDQALEDGMFEDELIDPKLHGDYDHEEMNRMVTCAAIAVHRFPDHRPKMSQVVQVLEGNVSPEKLIAQTSKPRRPRSQPT